MNKKKKRLHLVQNLAIICLSLSAVLLLSKVFSYETGAGSAFTNLISSGTTGSVSAPSSDLIGMDAPFNMVTTAEHGRFGRMLASAADRERLHASNLMQQTLGSATNQSQVSESDFRAALERTGLFFDYLTPIPASILSGWFDTTFSSDTSVRYLLVSAQPQKTADLYLWDGSGPFYRCDTAVEYSVLTNAISAFSADASSTDSVAFALEDPSAYAHLSPYTILSHATTDSPILSAAIPELAADVDRLLTLLDFNAHTNSRYTQSNGTEVVVESPRTLRIQTDGVILYSGDTNAVSELYHVSHRGDIPTAAEAVLAVRQLAETLLPEDLLGSTTLYLSRIEETEDGYTVFFDYLVDGVPVYFSNSFSALEAEISGSTITDFRLQYRQYSMTEKTYRLMPLALASNLASDYASAFLTRGYADHGGESITADWLVR